jgi:hypothetical protein
MKLVLPIVALTFLVALSTPARTQTSTPAETAPTAKTPAAATTTPTPAPPAAAEKAPTGAVAFHADPVVICRDVQDRAPVDAGESFPSDVGTLVCFSRITGAESGQIYHRWYVGDRMVFEMPISVNGSSWRCWSRKTVAPSWQGECRVDIATESGDVIGSATFTLTSAAAPASSTPAATTPAPTPPAPKTQG